MTNLSLFVIGVYWLRLVHWLFITRGSTTVSKQGEICFSHLLWNIWSWSSLHSVCTVCAQVLCACQQRFFFGFFPSFFLSVCMFGIVCRRCSCKIGWWWVQWKGKSGEREREGRGRLRKTTEGKPDSEEVSLGTLSSSRQQSVSGGPPHPGCCQWRHQALQDPTSPDHQEPSAPGRSVLFYWFHPTPQCFHTILVTLGQDPQAFICCSQQP